MGRKAIRRDLRRRPQTYSLDERQIVAIEVFADAYDLTRSQALRRLIEMAEERLSADLKHEIAKRKADSMRAAREPKKAKPSAPLPKCPACGEADGFVILPEGRWRCDFCLERG